MSARCGGESPIVVRAKVPATSANMGPGFDCMGVALSLFNTVEARFSSEPSVAVEGDNSEGIPCDESNLIYRAAETVLDRFEVDRALNLKIQASIPLSRGLGSSAACIVGGMAVANVLLQNPLSTQELLNLAADMEGHPDNVVPAYLGGLTLAALDGGTVVYQRMAFPSELGFVVAIPELEVSTKDARRAIPSSVSHEDAVFNVSRAAMLVAGLSQGDFSNLGFACQDRLHQPYRRHLVPGFAEILEGAQSHGALACYLSGAGPSVACLVLGETSRSVGRFMVDCFKAHGISARYKVLNACTIGTEVSITA